MTRSREGDGELPPLTIPYLEDVRRAGTYEKLLVALWRLAFDDCVGCERCYGDMQVCRICGEHGQHKIEVKHQPGCALFGVDRTILAQLDAFDAMPEPV